MNFFSNLGYKNASNDIVWEKPIVQKKIVHFILYSWKIRFTSSILSKTQPRLYPNISFMIPFSKGLYLLEALYSFFVYDSITNKYISLVTKCNRRENCILEYPRKINELSFVKLDSSITFIYNINDLSNCMEIECDNFSLTRFLNHPKFLITTKSFSIIQYENNNDQYVIVGFLCYSEEASKFNDSDWINIVRNN